MLQSTSSLQKMWVDEDAHGGKGPPLQNKIGISIFGVNILAHRVQGPKHKEKAYCLRIASLFDLSQ